MTSPHCPVCIDTHPLEQFRVLKCGHAFCLQVLEDLRKQPKPRKVCPVCREKLQGTNDLDGTQVYLTFVTEGDGVSQAKATAAALKFLSTGADEKRLDRVSRAAESTISLLEDGDGDEEQRAVRKLWKSLHDFKERVAPGLAKISSLQAQLEQLRQQVTDVTQERDMERKTLGRLERSYAASKRSKAENERVRDEALAAAEAATLETIALRGQVAELQQRMDQNKAENDTLKLELAKLTEDNRRYRTKAQKFKAVENDYKKRINHLESELATRSLSRGILEDLPFISSEGDDATSLRSSPSFPNVISSDLDYLDTETSSAKTYSSLHPRTLPSSSQTSTLFSSDWNLPIKKPVSKGVKRSSSDVLELDSYGRVKKAVAIGEKNRFRLNGGLR